MCLGAAMTYGFGVLYFGLDSPGDGAVALVEGWQARPRQPGYAPPRIVRGVLREQCADLFRDSCEATPDSPYPGL